MLLPSLLNQAPLGKCNHQILTELQTAYPDRVKRKREGGILTGWYVIDNDGQRVELDYAGYRV